MPCAWPQSDDRRLDPDDAGYPAQLQDLPAPCGRPIFVRGRGAWPPVRAVAVIGSRAVSPYGREAATAIAGTLARHGLCVVSGFARGVDAAAHQAALDAGGATVAVLGAGVDLIYPPEHTGLYTAIRSRGHLVSGYPPGTPPRRAHFPSRNRLLAALADGIVLVEAGPDSGTRHTVAAALALGRWVLVVPWPLGSTAFAGNAAWLARAEGCIGVVTDPAQPARLALGIAPRPFAERHALGTCPHCGPGRTRARSKPARPAPGPGVPGLTEPAARLLAALGPRARDLAALARAAGLDAPRGAAVVIELELLGLAERLPGDRYRRRSR